MMINSIRRTQTKILLLILILGAGFTIGLGMAFHDQSQLEQSMLVERQREKADLLREVVRQKSESLHMFTNDYSRWDDMIRFIDTRPVDSQWARDNLDVAIANFGGQTVMVFDSKFNPIFATSGTVRKAEEQEPIRAVCRRILPDAPFQHFFLRQPTGIFELFTAPVQPTKDIERKTTPRGYFVTGYFWEDSLLNWLSLRTGTVTTLSGVDDRGEFAAPALGENGALISYAPLIGFDGRPVAALESRYHSEVFADQVALVHRQVAALAIFGAVVVAVLLLSLYAWVSRPLEIINTSLNTQTSEPLLQLTSQTDEFGQIARLITTSFSQRLALVEEIVERRQAERNAHESKRALSSFISNLPGMAYRCRNDVERTVEYVSDGCVDVTGFTTEYFTLKKSLSLNKLIHMGDRDQVRLTIESAVASRQGYALTYRINAADKSERSVLEQGRAVYASDGKVTALEGIILDITDRVEAERERVFLQNKLNRAERVQALGLLAGGVAHDLNNMLAPVMAYPDLILSKLPENDPLRPKLLIIRDAAQQAVDVVQDLLTMARRGRVEMTSVNLNNVVEVYTRSANFLQLTAKHPDVAVVVDLAPQMDSIGGSVTHLNKALMNIVVNAFDAMTRGGQLTIRTRQRNVGELADGHRIIPGEYIILSVSDTGVGIPPEDMKKIFEPYFSRKQMGTSGTGLGLAVVYGTVKDHHGYYDIISKVGEGTEFILYFPAENQSTGVDADGSPAATLTTSKAI